METKTIINQAVGITKVNDDILVEILSTGKVYQSSTTRYHLLITRLKGRSVRFADHEKYLYNLAKEAGLWVTDDDLARAKRLDLEWHHSIQLFLGWVKRNYAGSYEKLSTKAGTLERQKKAREEKKATTVTRQKKLTKKRLESAGNDRESQAILMEYIVDNIHDIVAELVANDETKRVLIDALEAAGIR
ncbi:MAG: hypothetical protein WDA47_08905 [Bacilli bacterium]